MLKPATKIACLILAMVVILTTAFACAAKPEPAYADQIAENILQAMNENDYAKYSEYFDESMKMALPQATFQSSNSLMRAAIGDYVSKTFWKVEEKDDYTVVVYKVKFTEEPQDVIVRVIFYEIEGKTYVAGLWFDSPKLRESAGK